MLSLFYTKRDLALRTAIFYFGNYFATATGSLIAAGVLGLGGKYGLSGWQWLFIVEGILTLVIFAVFILLLPKNPTHTNPVHGLWDLFSDRDCTTRTARIAADNPAKSRAKAPLS
ncbi:hypothetical protein B0J12DRAFT_736153 [Macrophomina phaseolina]|uniref:Major facilitator superfamily (MFS) profile domain-containing protein n=1 Tax=Macrophomina phaseolina TaxID=35725 RepID=A0ABQ8GU76_9PEZI|nr:hypothetical protein B0J12DRAFT_736153 [Macrophomina phaseolina]